MVLEVTAQNVLVGIGIAVFANILYGVSGWLKSNESFNVKKFAGTVITALAIGAVAGVTAVPEIESAATQTQLLIIYVGLFTAPIVVDVFRTNMSGAVVQRLAEVLGINVKPTEEENKEPTQ